MWTVSKKEVADLLKLDLMSRLQEAREKTALFEQTHKQSFEDFEQTVLHGEEDFGRWEDYIEWKAYREVQQDLEQKIEALRRGDFEVAGGPSSRPIRFWTSRRSKAAGTTS